MKAIVVEDDPQTLVLLRNLLVRRGHEVEEFLDGEGALEARDAQIARGQPGWDIALVGLSLPRISGLELISTLRANRRGRFTYIVAVSGKSDAETLQRSFDAGADDYLVKPLDLNLLNFRLFVAEQHALAREDWQRTEQQLGESVRGWHATFDAIGTPIFVLNSEGLVQRCNRALAGLLAQPFERLIGQPASVVIKDSARASDAAFLDTIHLGKRRKVLLLHRSERWWECTVDPLIDVQDRQQGVICVMADVTERTQAEDALRVSEENYRGIFENAVEGIFQTTPEGQYITANPALVRMYGYDSVEDLRSSVNDIARRLYADPRRRDAFRMLMEQNDNVSDFESEVFRKDGSTIWISETARAVRGSDGSLKYYEGTVMDITQRKEAQEALRREELERGRLQAEMDVARTIQVQLLPRSAPKVPNLQLAGSHRSATETSGDYFDYLKFPNGKLGITVADVTGHGLGAALIMISARAYVRSRCETDGDLGRLLAGVNRLLEYDLEDGNFLTLCLALFDPAARTLHYASAGHDAPLVYRPAEGTFVELDATGPLLGVMPEAEFGVAGPLQLQPGDIVVFMTDGLFECMNEADETFGKGRVKDTIRAHAARSADDLRDALLTATAEFVGGRDMRDDVTLVVAKVL